MKPLEPPDTHHLAAAVGWLDLGNPTEARAELAGISEARKGHPDVLEVRWLICADQRDWGGALEAARGLVAGAPERSSGWLHQAYALRRVPEGGLQQAWDALLPVFDRFPQEPTIAYNLSCYACQMKDLATARGWLRRAMAIGGRRVKKMALGDADLEPLWGEVRGWD